MANKKLFPNAKTLPPKAPKIKSGRWNKRATVPAAGKARFATSSGK